MMNLTTETKPQIFSENLPPVQYVFVRKWVQWDEVQQFFNTEIANIAQKMRENGIQPAFPPSIFIHRVDEYQRQSELSAAIQTTTPIAIKHGGTIQFPAGKVLLVRHTGPLEKTKSAHDALQQHVNENMQTIGVAIEEYRSDPTQNPDPSTWETIIYYRLYNGIDVPRIIC